jgi:hypothetical protein
MAKEQPPTNAKNPPLPNGYKPKTTNKLQLSVSLIYAHIRKKAHIDSQLRRKLPDLQNIFGFNSYSLVKTYFYNVSYGQAIIIPISHLHQIQISPDHFDPETNQISIQVSFLLRQKSLHAYKATFSLYAATIARLQNNKSMAFLGPSYRSGRALVLLHAAQLPKDSN